MAFDIVEPGLRIQYVPDRDDTEACEAFGRRIAQSIRG
jgi:flavorubredoxin